MACPHILHFRDRCLLSICQMVAVKGYLIYKEIYVYTRTLMA